MNLSASRVRIAINSESRKESLVVRYPTHLESSIDTVHHVSNNQVGIALSSPGEPRFDTRNAKPYLGYSFPCCFHGRLGFLRRRHLAGIRVDPPNSRHPRTSRFTTEAVLNTLIDSPTGRRTRIEPNGKMCISPQ